MAKSKKLPKSPAKSKKPVAGPSPVAPEYPMPKTAKTNAAIRANKQAVEKGRLKDEVAALTPAKEFGAPFDAGGGIMVQVEKPKAKPAPETFSLVDPIDTPAKLSTALIAMVNDELSAEELLKKIHTPPTRFRNLGSVEAGKLARIRFTHQEVEVLEQYVGSSTKVRVLDTGKVCTMAPATDCQVIEAPTQKAPTQRQNAPAPASKQEGMQGATEAPASAQKQPQAKKAPAASAPKASVANSFGIPVEQTPSGRCTIFGESTSGIFRWAGSKGWTEEDCAKLTTALSLEGVSRSSFNILLKAGAKGFRLPSFTPTQEAALLVAAGKSEPKKQAAPKKSKK